MRGGGGHAWWGHAWRGGACMVGDVRGRGPVVGGLHGRGRAWQRGMHGGGGVRGRYYEIRSMSGRVRILLKWILVYLSNLKTQDIVST